MNNNIVVTGGLGFIGSNLIELLIQKKYFVINIDKISYASNFYNTKKFNNSKNYKFYKSDINNKKEIRKIFNRYKPLAIFNLAAETHVDRSIDSPDEFIKSNIVGVYNLLEIFSEFQKKWQNLSVFSGQNKLKISKFNLTLFFSLILLFSITFSTSDLCSFHCRIRCMAKLKIIC